MPIMLQAVQKTGIPSQAFRIEADYGRDDRKI